MSLLAFRNDSAFVLKNEMITPDTDFLALYAARNPMCNDILHPGVSLLMFEMFFLCFPHHSICHGMRIMLLQARCEAEHLIRICTAKSFHPAHTRQRTGQCSGFVKNYCCCFRTVLQEPSSLNGDMICACFPHGRQDRDRHGKFQGTAEIDHQDCCCSGCISGQEPGESGSSERPWHQPVSQVGRFILSLRF